MGFAVRVRSAGQKYGPTCHQRDRADVTEFVALVRLSSLGQHVGVMALAGYKRRKSALTAGPIVGHQKCSLILIYTCSSPCSLYVAGAISLSELFIFVVPTAEWTLLSTDKDKANA